MKKTLLSLVGMLIWMMSLPHAVFAQSLDGQARVTDGKLDKKALKEQIWQQQPEKVTPQSYILPLDSIGVKQSERRQQSLSHAPQPPVLPPLTLKPDEMRRWALQMQETRKNGIHEATMPVLHQASEGEPTILWVYSLMCMDWFLPGGNVNPGLIGVKLGDTAEVYDIYRKESRMGGANGFLVIDNDYYGIEGVRVVIPGQEREYFRYLHHDLDNIAVDEAPKEIAVSKLVFDREPSSGLVYALYTPNANAQVYSFGYLNFETQQLFKISDTNIPTTPEIIALMITHGGQFYVADNNENLYNFDPQSGEASLINKMDVGISMIRKMTIDHHNDRIFLMNYTLMGQSEIYEINPATAEGSLLSTFPSGHMLYAMGAPTQYHATDAPSGPTDLTPIFEGGTTNGTLTFTMPTTKRDGTPLSGTLGYTVMVNNMVAATGNAAAGETVTVNASLAHDGFNALTVKADGGLESHLYIYGGDDKPLIDNVTVVNDDKTITLNWDVGAEGVNGGYINSTETQYVVTRYPDSLVVATVTGVTTYTEVVSIDQPTLFQYGVKAIFNGQESGETFSEKILVSDGLPLPYHEDFSSADAIYYYYTPLNSGGGWHYAADNAGNGYPREGIFYDDFIITYPDATEQWLYTPEFHMEPGVYHLSLLLSGGGEHGPMSLYFGQGLLASEMEEVLPPTILKTGIRLIDVNVRVETTGKYRFALLHSQSPENDMRMILCGLDVYEAKVAAPDAPELTVTAAPEGENAANIQITAPTKTVGGAPLERISKIEVHRYDALYTGGEEDELVKTFENPMPGETLTFSDVPFSDGCHEKYWAMAYNDTGCGAITSTDYIFVGMDMPLPPSDANVWMDGNPHITWKPSAGTYNGYFADFSQLTYNLYSYNRFNDRWTPLIGGLTDLSYTDTSTSDQDIDQHLCAYAISAQIGPRAQSEARVCQTVAGRPYELPLFDSFMDFRFPIYIWQQHVHEGVWSYGYTWKAAHGDDPRSYVMYGTGNMDLTSGRINLQGAKKPHLTYHYYYMPGQTNRMEVSIVKPDGTEQIMKSHDYATVQGDERWVREDVDLSAFVSEQWVMVKFIAHADNSDDIFLIDDIRMFDLMEKNLSVKRIQFPYNENEPTNLKEMRMNAPMTVKAYIVNTGEQTASGYHLNLYANNKMVNTVAGPDIASLEGALIGLRYDPDPSTPTNPEVANLYFEIVWDEDQNPNDNISEAKPIIVLVDPSCIGISDLKGEEKEDGTLLLSWSAPANEQNYTLTETFEKTWSIDADTENLGHWKLVDADGGYTKYVQGMSWITATDPASFILYRPNFFGASSKDPFFGTHQGEKCAISMGTVVENGIEGNDDWMISQELTGEAQTVSLWAKSLVDIEEQAESFQILYSTTGREIGDFVVAETYTDIPETWEKYKAKLPEGARYMAIRNIGKNRNMLFIDDVVMRVAGMKPLKYVIWRDNEPIDTVGADQTTYTDRVYENSTYTYNVSVLYEEGTSGFSNDALLTATNGITEMGHTTPRVTGTSGRVDIYGSEGESVSIYSPDGSLQFTGAGRRHLSVALKSGTYIVRIGVKVSKVTVR
ncbi:MAG: choice-of-anchor J domain-containing protein [Prevotella sp.]|nr:choice-of-anchor J domain-containing protein [Prevotella sp.]